MRLLTRNATGNIHLTKDLLDREIPRYAILSHTWGSEEILFQDLADGADESRGGYDKIRFCGNQARDDGLQYFWVDTCCIDKANNTELQEAINSMFRWYQNAAKCYVYLADVSTSSMDATDKTSWELDFRKSRWFTRGWTLQELIAPASVEFFSREGVRLGDRKSLEDHICHITGLPLAVLRGSTLSDFGVSERLAWVAARETTRKEDKAYSLLGIFGIHMPLIYGEGENNAFRRLLKEIEGNPDTEIPSVPILKGASFDIHGETQPNGHILEDPLPNHLRQTVWQDSRDLAGLQTASSEVFKRRLEETTESRSTDACKAHHEDFEAARPFKRRNLDSMSQERHATVAPGSDSDIDATIQQSLVEQLYFPQIDERLTNLSPAQGKTCRWFLAKPEYRAWRHAAQLSDDGGFLWIKGNPGTGKSTLMKLLFEEARLNAKGDPSQITLSFFFLARGAIEEKSTTGLYRSLLYQLFERAPDMRDSLGWMTANGAKGIALNGWREPALKQTLTHAIPKLGDRTLTIFVDALDECDQSQAAGMVSLFEELCDRARETQVQLRICFSSRHYPTVIIKQGAEVVMEDEGGHTDDIQHYIKSKLRWGKSKEAEPLRSEILNKSSGIFLWVVLVLDILNAEYPNSSVSIKKIRNRLKEIPQGLHDLFEMILARDGENIERLQICLMWILFAARSLKPQELYFAVQLGLDAENSSYWDKEDINLDDMKTFVRVSSKGLAEVTRNKASEVQFIHEAVRDFLLARYGEQWSGTSGDINGHCHDILRNCCLAQLNAPISQVVEIPDTVALDSGVAAQLRETVKTKFPFLEYSVSNVLHHSNSAQQHGMEQNTFLDGFPLPRWLLLNNALERAAIRRYKKSVSLLYILAERDLAELIRIHPRAMSCFDVEDSRYGPPIFAALATDSSKAIESFVGMCSDVQPEGLLPRSFCKHFSERMKWRGGLGRTFTFSPKRSVLSYVLESDDEGSLVFFVAAGQANAPHCDGSDILSHAAGKGYETVVNMLLSTTGIDVELRNASGLTPVSLAAQGGHETIVRLLLDYGADAESKDNLGITPLSWAAREGQETVVRLLLDYSADAESKDNLGITPLSWAAREGQETVVRLLLEYGAEAELKDAYGRTPLSLAAREGQETVVRLLLDYSANVDSKDKSGITPLSRAAREGQETVVRLLLEYGAEAELKDAYGRTSLSLAVQGEYETIVRLLLDNGANAESKDTSGWTPLLRAAQGGYETIVRLLLDNGANAESKDTSGRTPLSWAAQGGYETIVRLLLGTGRIEVDIKDENGSTPLSCAASSGCEAIVKLLLDTGRVEVDTKDESGATPLSCAAQSGHVAVLQLLLDTGNTNINAKDNNGRTPLAWAVERGNVAVTRLLLDNSTDSNSKDSYGHTPLMCVARCKTSDRAGNNALQSYQLQLMSLEHENKRRLMIARQGLHDGFRTSIACQEQDGLFPPVLLRGDIQEALTKLLLERGADVALRDNLGRTVLSYAAMEGKEGIVKLLLDMGRVKVDSKDNDGKTPLSWAAERGYAAIVRLLQDMVS